MADDDTPVPADAVTPQPSRFTVIQPELLGKMAVLEDIDSETIITNRMARFKQIWTDHDPPAGAVYDVENLEFDPIRICQEASADFEMLLRNRINQAAKDVTLAFGYGTNLDGIASRYPYGVPRLEGESDDQYRRRIWLSPNILTPHGVHESYVFWALSSDPTYRDAAALTKPASGHVFIPVLLDDIDAAPWFKAVGTEQWVWTRKITQHPIPPGPQRLATFKYINEPGRKGLTDVVHVVRPKVVHTSYDIDVWTFPGVDFQDVMLDTRTALDKYVESRRWLGNDHTRMDIFAAIKQQAVYNADIKSPAADVVVGSDGFVQVDSMKITWKGEAE